jgi:hypothetical protein
VEPRKEEGAKERRRRRNRVLLEMLLLTQLIKNPRFIIMFTAARNWILT